LIERAGLKYIEHGTREEFLEVADNPDLWHPTRGFPHLVNEGIRRVIDKQVDLIRERSSQSDLLVIANCLGFGCRIACEKYRVPLVTVHLQPAVIPSAEAPPTFQRMIIPRWAPKWLFRLQFRLAEMLVIDRAALPVINPLRARLGLPPISKVLRWYHSPDCVVCLFPEWYAPKQADWPPNSFVTDFPFWDESSLEAMDPTLAGFLDQGSAPIAFTAGTGNMLAEDFFRESIEACRRMGQRGLLLTKFAQQIPESLPDTVMHVRYCPFSQVLPRCAAIVHHGGVGTTSQALRAGIPQLIVPLAHDQPDNAARVKRLGVGKSITTEKYQAESASQVLSQLISSPEVAQRCRTIASHWNAELLPFGKACDVIEDLLAKGSAKP
jgi:UDP:flavonoid glycosyltransferase YjiC (YdhE family)